MIDLYVMTGLEMFIGFWFFTGFLQKKGKLLYGIWFAALGMTVLVMLHLQGIWAILVFIIFLMATGKLLYRADFISAALYAVVTVEMMALCFGLFNSLSCVLFPVIFEKAPGMCGLILEWAGNILAFLLAVLCYRAIRQCCACGGSPQKIYIYDIDV